MNTPYDELEELAEHFENGLHDLWRQQEIADHIRFWRDCIRHTGTSPLSRPEEQAP